MSVIDEELQQWDELSRKATLGPWKTCGAEPDAACPCGLVWSVPADVPVAAWHSEDGHSGRAQDVLFIAAARTAVPALIAEVRKLCKLVDPDVEHVRLVLLKDATDAAIAEVGPRMDANYGKTIERLANEKEKLRAEVERLSNVYAVAACLRTFPVPFDDHLRLVDAVDTARAAEHAGVEHDDF